MCRPLLQWCLKQGQVIVNTVEIWQLWFKLYIVYELPMKSKWMKCRTDHIPRSAALGDLLRGHLVQSVHAPCTYTWFNTVCCWEGPHWEPTPYMVFFFFFKKYKLSAEFGSKKYAKMGEFGLRNFNKGWNGQFWQRNLVLPICATGCYTDGWGRRGKAAASGYQVQSLKEPRFVPPILELWSDEWGEVMICAGTDLQWFFAICTNEMM